jgi:hypothetical protein
VFSPDGKEVMYTNKQGIIKYQKFNLERLTNPNAPSHEFTRS